MQASTDKTGARLTIGLFSAFYPPHMGGVEQFTQNLAHTLASMGHTPIVIACNTEGSPDVEAEEGLVEVHRLPARVLGGRFPLPTKGREFNAHWEQIAQIPFDAIVVNTRFYPLSLLGAKLAASKGLRPIVIEHGSSHLTIGSTPIDAVIAQYEHAISRRLLTCNPVGYGVSQEALQWMAHFGIETKGVIHNAIDAQAFRACSSGRDFRSELDIPQGVPIAAFTGRMVPEKGARTLVEAAQGFVQSPELHFVLAGEGPQLEELRSIAGPNVHFTGRLSRPDVAALLQQSSLFCFPSSYPEGLPTSLLEAAACECYLITTPVAGAHEIVATPDMGCILPDASPHALATAIREALANAGETQAAAANCRQHVESSFSWQSSAVSLLEACKMA